MSFETLLYRMSPYDMYFVMYNKYTYIIYPVHESTEALSFCIMALTGFKNCPGFLLRDLAKWESENW